MIIRHELGEVWFKINYYGPGTGGKTRNLFFLRDYFQLHHRAERMLSVATQADSILMLELLPEVRELIEALPEAGAEILDVFTHHRRPLEGAESEQALAATSTQTRLELGQIHGWKVRLQLVAVPGTVYESSMRHMALRGTDGIVFVVDSRREMLEANRDSLRVLEASLTALDLDSDPMPFVIQYNKRDLPNALPLDVLQHELNPRGAPFVEARAHEGAGVLETLEALAEQLRDRYAAELLNA